MFTLIKVKLDPGNIAQQCRSLYLSSSDYGQGPKFESWQGMVKK